tara:strand:+ start:2486 stop:3187 length:702 start_codon:yes stop_codon:yes gene_type:complete
MSRSILIAGGNSGIGKETLKLLQEDGKQVFCAARSHGNISQIPKLAMLPFYAEDEDPKLNLPDEIHGAVYFPGTITLKPFRSLKIEDFLNDLQINFFGAVRFLQQAYPALKKSGSASVVLFSTVAVEVGLPYHASIAAAKGAVEGLAKSLAAEWAPGIRVNCIAPSLTDTPLGAHLLDTDAKRDAAASRHPLKQIGDPRDVAKLVRFLLSDGSKFMTGQVLRPDGGLSSVRTV